MPETNSIVCSKVLYLLHICACCSCAFAFSSNWQSCSTIRNGALLLRSNLMQKLQAFMICNGFLSDLATGVCTETVDHYMLVDVSSRGGACHTSFAR